MDFLYQSALCVCIHVCTSVQGHVRTHKQKKKILTLCKYCMHEQFLGFYCENAQYCNPSAKSEDMLDVTHYGTESLNAALI